MRKLNTVADGLGDNPPEGTRVNVFLQDLCCTAARVSNGGGGNKLDSEQHTFSAREADGLRADKFEYSTPLRPVLNFFWTTYEPSAKLLQLWLDTPERINAATFYNNKTKKDEPVFPCTPTTMLNRMNCSSTNENWLSAKEQQRTSDQCHRQSRVLRKLCISNHPTQHHSTGHHQRQHQKRSITWRRKQERC